MVEDNAVGREEFFSSALVKTDGRIAVFSRAGGTVGVDLIPDFGERGWGEFLQDAVFGGGGPLGEADKVFFRLIG